MRSLGTRLLLLMTMAVFTVSFMASHLQAQEGSVRELAKKLPGYVNSIMSVNAKKIRNSAIARNEGWTETYEGKVSSGLIFLPEVADTVLLGAAMDFQTFHPRTTAMLFGVPNAPSTEIIRERTNGRIDTMIDVQVVETEDDNYVVRLNDNTVAAYRPAMRSDFLPWLKDLKAGKTAPVRSYLDEGLSYSDLGTEIIIAFDLEHVISREKIYMDIQDSEEIKEAGLDPKEVSRLVASCRGVTLGVTVTDKITGAVKIDFAEDVSALEPLKSGIALGVLERIGLFVDDFNTWETSHLTSVQMQVKGPLSKASFRRLLTIVDAAPSGTMSPAGAGGAGGGDPTMNYFKAVDGLVQGVRPKLNAGHAYTRNAKWLAKFAEKIDTLPIVNVDPEVVDFGVYAAGMLRDASQYMIDTNAETKTKMQGLIASGARSGGGVGWGGGYGRVYGAGYGSWRGGRWGSRYGRSGRGTGQRLRDATRANAKTEAVRSLKEMFSEYDTQRADLNRQLQLKAPDK